MVSHDFEDAARAAADRRDWEAAWRFDEWAHLPWAQEHLIDRLARRLPATHREHGIDGAGTALLRLHDADSKAFAQVVDTLRAADIELALRPGERPFAALGPHWPDAAAGRVAIGSELHRWLAQAHPRLRALGLAPLRTGRPPRLCRPLLGAGFSSAGAFARLPPAPPFDCGPDDPASYIAPYVLLVGSDAPDASALFAGLRTLLAGTAVEVAPPGQPAAPAGPLRGAAP